jgi:hypothetical protein
MKGHRTTRRATHAAPVDDAPVGGLTRLEYFAHFASARLEIGPAQHLVVGDDM